MTNFGKEKLSRRKSSKEFFSRRGRGQSSKMYDQIKSFGFVLEPILRTLNREIESNLLIQGSFSRCLRKQAKRY